MAEHRYTIRERRRQLKSLAKSLRELIPTVAANPEFSDRTPLYQVALDETERLLQQGFVQEDLSNLAKSIPDLFFRHKEWMPPVEETDDGKSVQPEWFVKLESRLVPVLRNAMILRELGYY